VAALNTLEWPTQVDIKAEVFVDRDRLTATVVLGDLRIRCCQNQKPSILNSQPSRPKS
jgi:hypothetical protein